MAKGIRRKLDKVRERVIREIRGTRDIGGKYAAALSGEGYFGGYRDALDDVGLALSGITPRRHGWWQEVEDND